MISGIHHVAIIASDYQKSKAFYTEVLGLTVIREIYRAERDSYKLDLALNGVQVVELFSFPNPPKRVSRPEACGLRHLAFSTDNIARSIGELDQKGITCEVVRVDEHTNKRFTFFQDPDGLPIELYEI